MKKRKIYSKEFKLEALRQWEQGGQSARAVASSLGLPRSALYKWKEQLSKQGEDAFQGLGCRPAGPPDELTRLKNDIALVQACLERAVAHRCPPPGLIHHTDRGATWSAQTYRQALNREGMIASMSRKGDCWDNAVPVPT